jgi:agmatinase
MISEIIKRTKSYEGCQATFDEAKIVLFGAGFDGTSSYRPGSRFAPMSIRSETYFAQEDYSPYFDQDLTEKAVHDLGDLELVFGNTEECLQRIEKVSRFIVENNKIPVCIGGEHLITLPAIRPVIEKYPDLQVVQLDAHLDLMDVLFADKFSHGTVMRRIYELLAGPKRIYQVGIRSGNKLEYDFARSHTRLFPFGTAEFLQIADELSGKPVYLTVDLDVFDPSLIRGTGTPEAGGIFFQDYIEVLRKIKSCNLVGADMVELAPQIDTTNVSTIVASKILRELLIIL